MNSIQKILKLNLNQRAFGLDFNDSKLKLIQLAESRKADKILAWNEVRLPEGVIENYEIKNEEKFKEAVLYAIKNSKGKFNSKKVVLSVSENKVFTRVISLPLMDDWKASEAVKWETESNIPIAIDEVYFDWQIIKKNEKKMDVLVMATPKKIVDSYLKVFNSCGIEVIACEAESSSIGRSILGKKEKERNILSIDIGLSMTSFTIYKKGIPVFTSSSSISGKMMTDAVAKHLCYDYRKAEKYKIKHGLGDNKKDKEKMLSIFEPILKLLSQEIEKTINFFGSNLSGGNDEIERIILNGGGSNLRGIKDYLTVSTKKTVLNSNPLINLNLTQEEKSKISSDSLQGFANVFGLAIRGKNYENYNKFITS